ncbi:MAG: Phospholipase YtpA [Promethearchaeota archaeon]|nr:MAG: Phospholipase YtpA [Candidatus Lokiarchaeota archaeon]
MNHIQGEFIGENNLKIYYQAWLPDQNPKAIIQIVHGFAEHSGRYENVVNKLVPLGYAIYADDHRGHGKSEGITNYVDSFDQYVEDEKKLYDIANENHPNIKYFILGHSMGSGIAIYFIEKYEDLIDGLILSGTGTAAGGEVSGLVKFMSRILSKLAPKMTIDPKLDPERLSHDPQVVEAYKDDPLVHHQEITTRLGYEMIKKFGNVEKVVSKFKLPLLVQSGSKDQAMHGIEDLKNHFTMNDKTINIYDGLYHEVYNEIKEDREKVLDDLVKWLENHI